MPIAIGVAVSVATSVGGAETTSVGADVATALGVATALTAVPVATAVAPAVPVATAVAPAVPVATAAAGFNTSQPTPAPPKECERVVPCTVPAVALAVILGGFSGLVLKTLLSAVMRGSVTLHRTGLSKRPTSWPV